MLWGRLATHGLNPEVLFMPKPGKYGFKANNPINISGLSWIQCVPKFWDLHSWQTMKAVSQFMGHPTYRYPRLNLLPVPELYSNGSQKIWPGAIESPLWPIIFWDIVRLLDPVLGQWPGIGAWSLLTQGHQPLNTSKRRVHWALHEFHKDSQWICPSVGF